MKFLGSYQENLHAGHTQVSEAAQGSLCDGPPASGGQAAGQSGITQQLLPRAAVRQLSPLANLAQPK